MRVLIDDQIDDAVTSRLRQKLEQLNAHCDRWDGRPVQPGSDADVVVTKLPEVADGLAYTVTLSRGIRVVVLVDCPSPATTRNAMKIGASGVIDVSSRSIGWALGVVAVAVGVDVIPDGHAATMASRTADPPRTLSEEEQRFLRLIAAQSIESAGTEVGMSRRQSQRYMSTLYRQLGLQNRHEAAAFAGRWGLLE